MIYSLLTGQAAGVHSIVGMIFIYAIIIIVIPVVALLILYYIKKKNKKH